MSRALIDGDILVYRIGFASQSKSYIITNYLGSCVIHNKKDLVGYTEDEIEEVIMVSSPESVYHTVDVNMDKILKGSKCNSYSLYLSGKGNFRKEVDESYKANRSGVPKPLMYKEIRNYLIDRYKAQVVNDIEADDEIGKNASTKGTCICTVDKDLDQIPGWHYNWVKDVRYYIDDETAMRYKYIQLLSGDRVDNIKGIYNIAEKTASKILEPYKSEKEIREAVKEKYRMEFKDEWEEHFNRNEILITILRK